MADLRHWKAPNLAPKPLIEGRHVRLEKLNTEAHARDLFETNSEDSAIWQYLFYEPFSDFLSYSEWVTEMAAREDAYYYAIADRGSQRFRGVASLMRDVPSMGVIEVGDINFSVSLQKTPAATEAIFLLMRQVFEAGYRRFEWKCNALNMGSRRAAQRFGFSYEGIFRQHMVVKGQSRDTAWFAMIDTDWPNIQEAFEAWLDSGNFDEEGQQVRSLSELTRPFLVKCDPTLR